MIVDTWALLAVVFNEPGANCYAAAISASDCASIPALNSLEVMVVRGRDIPRELEAFGVVLIRLRIAVILFAAAEAQEAALAAGRAGKMSGRPTRLNYGDCMAYGAAKSRGDALSFNGGDFCHTGIPSALAA